MATEDKAPKEVTFDYLVDITDDFSDEIGKGAFGTVYKVYDFALPPSSACLCVKG